MLGYVIPDKGELKVREYEIYTGYYCGICKYIGSEYGQLPRMVLSYDAAFIALILASVDPAPDEPKQEHCVTHHIKYRTVIRNRAIEYAGDLMLILAWFKLLDDAQDEGKASAKAGLTAFRHTWKKLRKKHPDLCEGIAKNLEALNQLEKDCCPSIDRVAEGFALVMDEIFRDGISWLYLQESNEKNPGLHETFAKLGYHLGKWIYLIDAVDDIEENLETGVYNPLLYRFHYQDGSGRFGQPEPAAAETLSQGKKDGPVTDSAPADSAPADSDPTDSDSSDSDSFDSDSSDPGAEGCQPGIETPEAFRARIDERLRFNLYQYLAVIGETLEALDIQKNSAIIENVIYFGLNRRTDEVLRRIQRDKRGQSRL